MGILKVFFKRNVLKKVIAKKPANKERKKEIGSLNFEEKEGLDRLLFEIFEENFINEASGKTRNRMYLYFAELNLYDETPDMVYIYSNNSSKESPFYYDILKISSKYFFPVYIPVPILAENFLRYGLPTDNELRHEPDERVLTICYMLREYGLTFNIQKIISKKKYNTITPPNIKLSELFKEYQRKMDVVNKSFEILEEYSNT